MILAALRARFGYMRGNIRVFTIAQVLGQIGRAMAFPYASLFILALGGRPEQVGLINSLAPLAGLIAFPIAGYLTDLAGRVKLIAFTGAFSGLSFLLYASSPSWQFLAVLSLIQGLGVIQFPPSSALIADSLAPRDRVKGMATMNLVSGMAALVAPWVAGLLLDVVGADVGMRVLYYIMGALNLTAAYINWRFLRETSASTHKVTVRQLWEALRSAYAGLPTLLRGLPRSARGLGVVAMLGFVGNALAGPFWVVYATQELGIAPSTWGLILLVETGLMNLTYIPAGMYTDRIGRARVVRGALVLALVSMPLFMLARGAWAVLGVRMLLAISNGFLMPACAALMADSLPREMRGRAVAALGSGQVLTGASAGGTGGPGLGYLVIVPLMLASLLGGYLYALRPVLPWIAATVAVLGALLLAVTQVHDATQAEI